MSARMRDDSTRRVVLRPRSRAASTSAPLASAIGANTASSSNRAAKRSKNALMASSGTVASSAKATCAALTARSTSAWSVAGTCSSAPVLCTMINRSPGRNAARQVVRDDGDPVAAEDDALARLQRDQ